jgi:hypothetical protein
VIILSDINNIFEESSELKRFKEEYLNVNTEGVVDDTYENSAYIYQLLKSQDPKERLEYLKHLKIHYEGNFACLMKELIYRENTTSMVDEIEFYKKQFKDGELSLDEYKSKVKEIVKK